jgi:hypothetical protein
VDRLVVGPGVGVVLAHEADGFLERQLLVQGEVKRHQLRRAVDSGRAVDVDSALLQQLVHQPHSPVRLQDEVLRVHVLDSVAPVAKSALLAQQPQVVRGQAVLLKVALALQRQHRPHALRPQALEVTAGAQVAADQYLRCDLGEGELADVAAV